MALGVHFSSSTGLLGPVSVFGGLMLMGLSPLIRGGNRHLALILLEWLALAVLLVLVAQCLVKAHRVDNASRQSGRLSKFVIGALAMAPMWAALLQLIPLPISLWVALPGHAPYAEALGVAGAPEIAYRALSLAPDFTMLSFLAGLPISAAFLLAYLSPLPKLRVLIHALVGFAALQAVLGLLQMGPFPRLFFGVASGGRAIGTFANSNHLANYVAMTVPLTVLLLRQAITTPRSRKRERARRQRMSAVWSIVLFLLLTGIVISGSRGGTVAALVGMVLAVILSARRGEPQSARRWGLVGAGGMLMVVAAVVGVDALFSRFGAEKAGYFDGDRWQMVIATWHGAIEFWPFGSGFGTFANIFPAFHPAGLRGFVEHAHNDYVQFLMEGGLLAVLLYIFLIGLVTKQAVQLARVVRRHGLDSEVQLQVICGVGLVTVLLHAWVEFNMRIPANAMLAAFLLGVFLRPSIAPASRLCQVVDLEPIRKVC